MRRWRFSYLYISHLEIPRRSYSMAMWRSYPPLLTPTKESSVPENLDDIMRSKKQTRTYQFDMWIRAITFVNAMLPIDCESAMKSREESMAFDLQGDGAATCATWFMFVIASIVVMIHNVFGSPTEYSSCFALESHLVSGKEISGRTVQGSVTLLENTPETYGHWQTGHRKLELHS